jgi:ReqiPepy6 Gp37-like protein
MAVLSVAGSSVTFSGTSAGIMPSMPFAYPSAGSTEAVTAQLLDNTLTPIMPVDFFTLSANLYYNAVGAWSMVAPYSDTLWSAVTAGDFIIEVDWRGLFKFGGKCEQPGYTDSIPGATSQVASLPGPFITMSGGDYLALVANRIAYPNPTVAWASQASGSADTVTSMALESAIKYYVNRNMGPGAISARRMPYLVIATDQARGNPVTYTVKFLAASGSGVDLNLLDVIRTLITGTSTGPTGMGVSVKRNAKTLVFDVYIPRDLSSTAWFSRDLGNLTADQLYLTDPTNTNSLAMGATVGVEVVAASRTVWNVAEVYADMTGESSTTNLQSAAQLALAQGGYGPLLNVTVIDTPYLSFGRDYGLGDIVTIEVVPGDSYKDVVSSVALAVDPTQDPTYSVIPTIGSSANATTTDTSIIKALTARIQALERRLKYA